MGRLITASIPAGTMRMAGGAIPADWLLCDGTSYPTTTYPDLFAAIGYAFGGSLANFNVPDFQGRSPMGTGTGSGLTPRTLAAKAGAETQASNVTATVPAHFHNSTSGGTLTATEQSSGAVSTSDYTAGGALSTHSHTFNVVGNILRWIGSGTSWGCPAGSDVVLTQANPTIGGPNSSVSHVHRFDHTHPNATVTGTIGTAGTSGDSTLTASVTNNATAIVHPTLVVKIIIKV